MILKTLSPDGKKNTAFLQRLATKRAQSGVGLIEVMISVLIFVSGVLGVAGMQSQAIRVNHDSVQRSQAVWLAHAANERIKVNFSGLDSGDYQETATAASADLSTYCEEPPKQCIGTTCSAGEMARFDVFELMCRNATVINQQMSIDCASPCGVGAQISVTVSWDSRGATGGPYSARQQLTLAMRRN